MPQGKKPLRRRGFFAKEIERARSLVRFGEYNVNYLPSQFMVARALT